MRDSFFFFVSIYAGDILLFSLFHCFSMYTKRCMIYCNDGQACLKVEAVLYTNEDTKFVS